MFSSAPAQPVDAAPRGQDEAIARDIGRLDRLADIAMDLAEALRERAMAVRDDKPAAETAAQAAEAQARLEQITQAFERIARCVRLTLALKARLAEGPRRAPAPLPYRPLHRPEPPGRHDRLVRGRMDAGEAVRMAIEREALVESERDAALQAANKWINSNPLEDYLTRPLSDILRRLCRDLAIPYDPALWAEEPWALEERADPPITSAYRGWPAPDWGKPDWGGALGEATTGTSLTALAPHAAHPP